MDVLDEEILKLWKSLHNHNVKYIMIGGFATNLHGFNRITADIDLWIKDTLENRKKLREVFSEIELGDFAEIESMEFIPGWSSILLQSEFEIDIMTSIKGFSQERFDECYTEAPTAIIYDIPIKFLSINHLIETKKSTNRQKDKIDIEQLEKIKQSKKEK